MVDDFISSRRTVGYDHFVDVQSGQAERNLTSWIYSVPISNRLQIPKVIPLEIFAFTKLLLHVSLA